MTYDMTKLVAACPDIKQNTLESLRRDVTDSLTRGESVERFFRQVFQREHRIARKRCWEERDRETGEVPAVDYKRVYQVATNQLANWFNSLTVFNAGVVDAGRTVVDAMASVSDFTVTADLSDNPIQIMTYTAIEPADARLPEVPISGDAPFRLNLSPTTSTQNHEQS
jgi:hypothetical protein